MRSKKPRHVMPPTLLHRTLVFFHWAERDLARRPLGTRTPLEFLPWLCRYACGLAPMKLQSQAVFELESCCSRQRKSLVSETPLQASSAFVAATSWKPMSCSLQGRWSTRATTAKGRAPRLSLRCCTSCGDTLAGLVPQQRLETCQTEVSTPSVRDLPH